MNTAVQAMNNFSQSYFRDVSLTSPFPSLRDILRTKNFWVVSILMSLIFMSALFIVYVQAQNRLLFSHLQSVENAQNAERIEWTQLLLEEQTWSQESRVQQMATQKLQMLVPARKTIHIIQE